MITSRSGGGKAGPSDVGRWTGEAGVIGDPDRPAHSTNGAVPPLARSAQDTAALRASREEMVDRQLVRRAIRDPRVLAAMRRIPRHAFVPESLRAEAHADYPLPIGEGQTISQPYIVARMTELLALAGRERVLEIGTGSGYQAAVLAELAGEVYSIEYLPAIAARAERILHALGLRVHVRTGDGTLGWPEAAPFDRIVVTAAAPAVPPPLLEQLGEGGRLVIPVGGPGAQVLQVVERHEGRLHTTRDCDCVFVKLMGRHAWGGAGGGTEPGATQA
jgi:protein-L-isoaspartate(D-aspartate) O-methyltransferase